MLNRPALRSLVPILALCVAASCASTPEVESVLQDPAAPTGRVPVLEAQAWTRETLRAEASSRLEFLDARCNGLLAQARAEGASYDVLMDAARTLIFNADFRIQMDVTFRFDPADLPDPSKLIDAEDDVTGALKAEVRSLAQESQSFADRALELRPADTAGEIYSTLAIGLKLWSMSALQALANGATTTLPRRIEAVASAYPSFEGASSLRLKGRFQTRAPWPYKDLEASVATLERAVEVAPIPLNLLFLGDAYWSGGQEDAARSAWARGAVAVADLETEITSPLIREICRMRVLASGGPD